jgi:hypothetical protein
MASQTRFLTVPSNETHTSTTDSDARLYRAPGKEARLRFIGHGSMENRHSLLVDSGLAQPDGYAEGMAALHIIKPRTDRPRPVTLGADTDGRRFASSSPLHHRRSATPADADCGDQVVEHRTPSLRRLAAHVPDRQERLLPMPAAIPLADQAMMFR